MRYRWNCHHSNIVNIVFLNNLVQRQTFFIFCIFVFIRYKGSPLGRVSFDGLNKSQRHGTTFLIACATAALYFEGFWPRVQLQILISRVVDRVCKSSAPTVSHHLNWKSESSLLFFPLQYPRSSLVLQVHRPSVRPIRFHSSIHPSIFSWVGNNMVS